MQIPYVINTRLVRGLDYYNGIVYEWVTTALGAQGAVCAGGRFDGLCAEVGGHDTKATGFAMGVERLLLFQEALQLHPSATPPQIVIISKEKNPQSQALLILVAEKCRSLFPEYGVFMGNFAASIKSQLKQADKIGATWALIVGESEATARGVSIKFLRESRPDTQCALSDMQVSMFN